MYTEEEAREKWCPFYRKGDTGNRAVTYNAFRCIASQCMAWRWDVDGNKKRDREEGHRKPELPPKRGYCGLAGRPE